MVHLYLIIYSLSLLSGVLIMGVLLFQYRLSRDKKILAYFWFKLSYTAMLIWSLITLYLEINTDFSLMYFFSPVILLLSIPLLVSYYYLKSKLNQEPWKPGESVILIFYTCWTMGWAVTSFFYFGGIISFITIAAVLILFFIFLVRGMRQGGNSPDKNQKLKETKRDIRLILVFLIMAFLELVFLIRFSVERGFIFSLALFYIVINILDWREYLPGETRKITQAIPEDFFKYYKITPMEQRVARALVQGQSNKEMAYNFGVAENTIKNQIYSIYKKTASQSRVEFINRIMEARIGQFAEISPD